MRTHQLKLTARLGSAAIFAALLLTAPILRSAETNSGPVRPLLWKIATPKPSYVFGTIHIADPRVLNYGAAVSNAFGQADVVVTEMELDAKSVLKMAETLMGATKPLSEVLSKPTVERLEKELQRINPLLTVAPFDKMHVWAMAATVSLLEEQLKSFGQEPLDLMLSSRAKEAGKATAGLETLEEQMAVFGTLTEAEQVRMLEQTLDSMEKARKDGRKPVDELKAAYLTGDADKLMAKMHEWMQDMTPAEREKFLKAFLTDRNVRMVERIQKLVKDRPGKILFIAIGAAHIPGDKGVLKLLEKAGYAATRVENP